jgi:hypothetical protein
MRQRGEGRTGRASLPALAAFAVAHDDARVALVGSGHAMARLVAMAWPHWSNWAYWPNW